MRGYQRKVIFMKNTGSSLFDEAYFVVSPSGEAAAKEQGDMVLEANRIISENLENSSLGARRESERRKKDFLVPFFLGVLISSAFALMIYLFYLLL